MRGLKLAGKILGALLVLLAVTGAAFWLWPELALRLAGVLLKSSGSEASISFGSASGPLQDFTVWDGSLRVPGAEVSVRRFSFHLKASELLRGRVHLAWADIDGVRVVLLPAPARERRRRRSGGGPPPLTIDRLGFTDGVIARRDAEKPLQVLARDIHGEMSLDAGRVTLRSLSAEVLESTVTAHGSATLQPLGADLQVDSRGRLRAAGRLRGSPGAWRLDAEGRYGPAPWHVKAGLTGTDAWTLDASVDGLPPSALPGKFPPALKPLAGSVRASGRGFARDTLTADARLEGGEQGGPGAAVDARISSGTLSWRLRGTGPLTAASTGTLRLSDRLVDMRASGQVPAALAARFSPSASGDVSFSARLTGALPAPAWTVQAVARNLTARNVKISSATLAASGTTFASAVVDAEAFGLSSGGASLTRLAAKGAVAVSPDALSSRWETFAIDGPSPLKSLHPFSVKTGSGTLEITGLELAGGGASLSLDARQAGGKWQLLSFKASGVDTRPWAAAGIKLPLEGIVDGEAELTGSLAAPVGTLSVRVASAVYAGSTVGLLRASGELTGTEARLRVGLDTPGGAFTATAVVPWTLNTKQLPDFDVRVKTAGFKLDPWAARVQALKIKDVVLICDLSVIRKGGRFTSQGKATLKGKSVELKSAGVELTDLDFHVTGQGEVAKVSGKAATGKKKHDVLEVAGELRAYGPSLKVNSQHLHFDADVGAKGEAEIALELRGRLGAPAVTGEVRITRANYTPPKKKKEKGGAPAPSKAPPAAAGPETLDIAVRFDRNVWYKDGDSSIEFRGDLAVKKNAYEPLRVLGTVETVRGTYAFYGRAFDIQSMHVVLTEDNQKDPAIEGLAQYLEPQSGTKVLLRVEGSALHPKLDLTSEPPMEQRDIISILAFGKPLNDISGGANQQASDAAQQVMAGYVADSLRQTVFKKLDLDVLQIRQEPGSSQTDITVGRYLTKKLFVSYGQTLGQQGQRRVNAEYTLTDHFSLEGKDSSEGKYVMDFLFKFGFK